MSAAAPFRPRRSCLYMPGANTRALEKARDIPADMLILDLEDAVAPETKSQARELLGQTVAADPYGYREVIIRVNALDSEWAEEDLAMVAQAKPDGVLIPKVVSGQQVKDVDDQLTTLGVGSDMGLWVMIEMPMAILNIQEIAAASGETRLKGLVLGPNDLAKEIGATPTPERTEFLTALSLTIAAARAYGLVALDGVYNDFKNEAGLIAESEHGRNLGFDGKTLIHPAQVEVANRVFSPDPAAVAHAEAVIAAFALPEHQGKGAIQVDGALVELLHLEQAEELVRIHEAIQAQAR